MSTAQNDDDGATHELVVQLRDEVAMRVPDDVVVRPAPDGFAVGYPEPLVMRGPDGPTTTHLWAMVACDPTTLTLTITDLVTGTDVSFFELSRSAFVFKGRVTGDRRTREYGTLPDGTRGLLSSQVHSPKVLHTAIREAAAELGWQEKQPTSAVVGKAVGIGTAVAVVLAGLVVGVLALTGRLG
ncbi:hypothetical protein ICW40_02895 [Actinotalea ferrariae]|uniref:hypothetical protein n=1 Tax=Actinotalea ferrariae TaxID=1386098 RepID=UPI001C8C1AAD|nr:hypothetical protein [Actinotalea ferrariae]MBX9243751.1 hypothetical protein [Actinotalea ferrariae]